MAKKQQAIVADRAGTTRDINRAVVRYEGRELEIMDTAGIRRSGKIERGIEHFSVLRSLQSHRTGRCLLPAHGRQRTQHRPGPKIAGMIKEAGKGLVLVVSSGTPRRAVTPLRATPWRRKSPMNLILSPGRRSFYQLRHRPKCHQTI